MNLDTTAASATYAQPAPKCILVVEGEHLIRIMASEALRDGGYNVLEAASADETLLLLGPVSPDLLVSDVRMPGSMDGLAMLATLRKSYPTLPVIITSGHRGALDAPPDDYTYFSPKPVAFDELIELVQNTIGGPVAN